MHWFKKAQMAEDRSYSSISNMKVLRSTVGSDVEAEWEDAEDFRRQHYTRETGYAVGDVGGEIGLAGKVYIFEVDSPELYLKEVFEQDPPPAVIKIVEDATSPVSWDDVRPELNAEVTGLEKIDVNLYSATVRISVSGSYRYNPSDYGQE